MNQARPTRTACCSVSKPGYSLTSSSGFGNLGSGLSSASDKLWTRWWDSEPQLPHLATSQPRWGKRGEHVWQLAGPYRALHKHWCPPLVPSSTQLLTPVLYSEGSHDLLEFKDSQPCDGSSRVQWAFSLWVWRGSEPLDHPQLPLHPTPLTPEKSSPHSPLGLGARLGIHKERESELWVQEDIW